MLGELQTLFEAPCSQTVAHVTVWASVPNATLESRWRNQHTTLGEVDGFCVPTRTAG